MEPFLEPKICFGCGSCAAACPRRAIAMRPDAEGFARPQADGRRCTGCGVCRRVCPARARLPRREGRFFALRAKDEALLHQSSSGGAFSLLAGRVLDAGGLVCGACFDSTFRVVHRLGTDIAPMRKSKYVQSDMTNCFAPLRAALGAGRQVLFSGTPCQCHAVLAFLGHKPAGLHLVSLVCRGAASPGFWRAYVRWLEKDGPLEHFDFRDKRRPNDGHTVAYTVAGRETSVPLPRDGFSRLYSLGLLHRPSCYACPYCRPDNGFDFTVGDFWGVEKCLPALADGRGTSLVIARGSWAMAQLEALGDKALLIPCTEADALQPALRDPVREPLLRRFLFRDFARTGADGAPDMALLLKKYSGLCTAGERPCTANLPA